MDHATNSPAVVARALPIFRRGATAVGVGRVVLGVVALAWPSLPIRPWVGASADDQGAQLLGQAMGARDLALGLGVLAAVRKSPSGSSQARAWYAAGTFSDALDLAITATAWGHLPRTTRWLIAASAGGAAIVGVAGMMASPRERDLDRP